MSVIEVSSLKLSGDPRRSHVARLRLEDALHTEVPDDTRLILVRHMSVAAQASSARPAERQTAMRQAWLTATGGARHGTEDSANGANCVWFADEAEAEMVLLERLLKGLAVTAWFWKLAVPQWRGKNAAEWLDDLVEQALRQGEEARLIRLGDTCIAAGAAPQLLTALERHGGQGRPTAGVEPLEPNATSASASGEDEPALAVLATRSAQLTLARFSKEMLQVLHRLARSTAGQITVRALVRAQALRISPALALRPQVLSRAASLVLEQLSDAATPEAAADCLAAKSTSPKPKHPPLSANPSQTSTRSRDGAEAAEFNRAPSPAQPVFVARGAATADRQPDQQHSPLALILPRPSLHAGLWLIVPALSDLGLRQWFASNPELLGDNPGGQLVRAIALHHRTPPRDPALAGLEFADAEAVLPEWTMLWRKGLDRWLRRRARRRLHDLVRRPGKLLWSEGALQVSFPVADADLRLRRLTLDRDPGWTDWLGLSIRYRFVGEDDQ